MARGDRIGLQNGISREEALAQVSKHLLRTRGGLVISRHSLNHLPPSTITRMKGLGKPFDPKPKLTNDHSRIIGRLFNSRNSNGLPADKDAHFEPSIRNEALHRRALEGK